MKNLNLFLTVLLAVLYLFRADSASAKPEELANQTVELSPFEVKTERLDFNRWIKVRSPHFLIYTDASQKEAMLTAKHLEMTRLAVGYYFNHSVRVEPPVLVVLPTNESDWRKVRFTDVKWKVASTLVGYSRPVILLEDDWQESPGLIITLAAAHACDLLDLRGPQWFHTGLTEFFRTITFTGDSLDVGKLGTYEAALILYGWLDWPHFFQINRNSPEYYQDSRDHKIYFAQCAAFIHYLLTNPNRRNVIALLDWAGRLQAGQSWTEADFKHDFGVDTATLQHNITELLKGGSYTSGRFTLKPEALRFEMTSSTAHPEEVRELFVLLQTSIQRDPQSGAAIDAMIKRGLKNPDLREVLADACLALGKRQAALDEFKQIIRDGSANSQVFYRAARLELDRANVEEDLDALLGEENLEIEAWARRGIELCPGDYSNYEALAWAEAKSRDISAAEATEINQICHALSGHTATDETLAALAVACWRLGNVAKASQYAKLLADSPLTRPTPRKIALALRDRLTAARLNGVTS